MDSLLARFWWICGERYYGTAEMHKLKYMKWKFWNAMCDDVLKNAFIINVLVIFVYVYYIQNIVGHKHAVVFVPKVNDCNN